MSFDPLTYAWRSITLVHAAIFAALVLVPVVMPRANQPDTVDFPGFPLNAVMILAAYFLFAPIVGQVFGDKFSFSQVWPSSAVLGMIFAGILVGAAGVVEGRSGPIGFLVFAFVAGSVFLGLAFNLFLYVFPRMVGWGIVQIPKAPWGVVL